jgi:DNA-binding protein HU-beta
MARKAAVAKKSSRNGDGALTLRDIGLSLAENFDIPKSHANEYLAETITILTDQLKKGRKVRINGLGIFQVKKRAARKGRNPATGEAIKIKASKRVAFAPSRDLKTAL